MCIYFSHSSFNYSYFFLDDRLFHHVTPMKINLSVPAGQGRCLRPDHVEHKNLLLQWDFFFSLPISKTVNKLEETHPCKGSEATGAWQSTTDRTRRISFLEDLTDILI